MKATSQKFNELIDKDKELAKRISSADTERASLMTQVNTINEKVQTVQSDIMNNGIKQTELENTIVILSSDITNIKQDQGSMINTVSQASSTASSAKAIAEQASSDLADYEEAIKKPLAVKLYDKEADFAANTDAPDGSIAMIRESGRMMRVRSYNGDAISSYEIYNGYSPHAFKSLGTNDSGNIIIAYVFGCLYKNDDTNTLYETTDDLHGDTEIYRVDGNIDLVNATIWKTGTYKRKDIQAVYEKTGYIAWETAHDEWEDKRAAYIAYDEYKDDYSEWSKKNDELTQVLKQAQSKLADAQKQKDDWDVAHTDGTETNPYTDTVTAAQKEVNDAQTAVNANVEPAEVERADDPGDEPVIDDSLCRAKRRGYVMADGDTIRDGKVYDKNGTVVTGIDSTIVVPYTEAYRLYAYTKDGQTYYGYRNKETDIDIDRAYVNPMETDQTAVSAGFHTGAAASNTIAIGYKAASSAVDSIAIGANAKATAEGSIAIGAGSETGASMDSVFSVGSSSKQRRLINVANATGDHDATTLSQVKSLDSTISTDLSSKLDSLKTSLTKSISDNVATLTMKITANTTAITNETTARTKAISDEAKTRADQDTAIKNSISSLQSALEKKIADSITTAKSELETEMNAAIKEAIDDYKASASSSSSSTTNP